MSILGEIQVLENVEISKYCFILSFQSNFCLCALILCLNNLSVARYYGQGKGGSETYPSHTDNVEPLLDRVRKHSQIFVLINLHFKILMATLYLHSKFCSHILILSNCLSKHSKVIAVNILYSQLCTLHTNRSDFVIRYSSLYQLYS